jgi:predicted nuclease of predicted toxin-antitoxin system
LKLNKPQFLKLFIDQNVPKLVMAWLRQKDFEIVLLADVNLRRASDEEIALFAMQKDLAVLTQDRGFAKMYRTQ